MALPGFYTQADQDIYASGDKFIPQEQYRLGYTHPPSATQAAGAGITNTNVAKPYIWPPQGGGEGAGAGFSNTNKFGLNLDTLKTVTQGKWQGAGGPANMYGGTYVPTQRRIAQDEHGNWKDVETNLNVYHANIPYKGVVGAIGDFITGKKNINRDQYKGTWTGAEWDEEFDPTVAHKNLNAIQRWKAKRAFKKEQGIPDETAAEGRAASSAAKIADADAEYQWQQQQHGGGDYDVYSGGNDPGGPASRMSISDVTDDPADRLAKGGRIGYRKGLGVDPVLEVQEDENIYDFMQDQGIPQGEMASGPGVEESLNEMSMEIFGKPLEALTEEEYDILIDLSQQQAASGEGQGLASLV
jgi:hypothetical protein